MKKRSLLFSVIFLFLFSNLFSNTLILKQYFEEDKITNIEIFLQNEQLIIEKYMGEELLLEVYSNFSALSPSINTENDTLIIKNSDKEYESPLYCTVKLYIPVNFNPTSFSINNVQGITKISFLRCDDLSIFTNNGKLELENLSSKNLKIISNLSDINCNTTNCETFYIQSYNANINLTLNKNNYYFSKVYTTHGNINITYKANTSYPFLVLSEKPVIRNNKSYKSKIYINPSETKSLTKNENLLVIESQKGEIILNAD